MDQNVLYFFDGKPEALPLYEAFEERVFSEVGGVKVKVQKTQIAFSNRHNFAFVSFLPVRKAKERPEVYIVVTFGLGYRVRSPRIDAAVEPYPGRFTHHVLVSGAGEIDDELMGSGCLFGRQTLNLPGGRRGVRDTDQRGVPYGK